MDEKGHRSAAIAWKYRVYPPPSYFQNGNTFADYFRESLLSDQDHVKDCTRAFYKSNTTKVLGESVEVVSVTNDDPVRVVIAMGKTTNKTPVKKNVRLNRLLPIYRPITQSKDNLVILTATTTDFRMASMANVSEKDIVLEIGSSFGEGTAAIARYCHRLIGFDVSEEAVAAAKTRCEAFRDRVEFHIVDVFREEKRAISILQDVDANVVCIDIGGNRDIFSVMRMIQWVQNIVKPFLIIVKSEELTWDGTGRFEFENTKKTVLSQRNRKKKQKRENIAKSVFEIDAINYHRSNRVLELQLEAKVSVRGNGFIDNEAQWWSILVDNVKCPKCRHPLQAPLVTLDGVAVCRYHNYHPNGCQKADECEYRHDVCHICLQKDHVAKNCDILRRGLRT